MFHSGAVPIPNKLEKSNFNSKIKGSVTEGKTLIWNAEPGELGFMSIYGFTKPGDGTLSFVKYSREYNSVPILEFIYVGNKAEFTQLGGSYQNRSGWAYDSNGGSANKVNINWFSYGNYISDKFSYTMM